MSTFNIAPLRINLLVFNILFDDLVVHRNSRSCGGGSLAILLLQLPLFLIFPHLLVPLLLLEELLSYFRLFANLLHYLLLLIKLLLFAFTYHTWTFRFLKWHCCDRFGRRISFLNLFFFLKIDRWIYWPFQILKLIVATKLAGVDFFFQILGHMIPLTFIDQLHWTWSHYRLLL